MRTGIFCQMEVTFGILLNIHRGLENIVVFKKKVISILRQRMESGVNEPLYCCIPTAYGKCLVSGNGSLAVTVRWDIMAIDKIKCTNSRFKTQLYQANFSSLLRDYKLYRKLLNYRLHNFNFVVCTDLAHKFGNIVRSFCLKRGCRHLDSRS